MSLAVWEGSEVWEGFGFAKEHLAPVGAEVLCWGAAAPGFYFQLSSGSMQERVAAHRWLSCAGMAVLALGQAAPWVLGRGRWTALFHLPASSNWSAGRAHWWSWLYFAMAHWAGGRPGRQGPTDQLVPDQCWEERAGPESFPRGCSGLQVDLCLEQSCKMPCTVGHSPPQCRHGSGVRAAHPL